MTKAEEGDELLDSASPEAVKLEELEDGALIGDMSRGDTKIPGDEADRGEYARGLAFAGEARPGSEEGNW